MFVRANLKDRLLLATVPYLPSVHIPYRTFGLVMDIVLELLEIKGKSKLFNND